MVEKIEPGHYRVKSVDNSEDRKGVEEHKELNVVRGDTANESLSGEYGFQNSKWYIYLLNSQEIVPRLDFSPTAPESAYAVHTSDMKFVQQEFNTKKEAINYAEDNIITRKGDNTRFYL